MAGTAAVLKLKHLSAGVQTALPVMVLSYTQTAKPSFNSTSVYGRPDPIVTYQNTVRSFQCTMHTLPYAERKQVKQCDIPNVSGYSMANGGAEWGKSMAKCLATLYQMMYPAVVYRLDGGVGVFQIQGPPLLEIAIPGILNSTPAAQGVGQRLIFVPETFQVTKLTDTNKINLVISGPKDLKYLVPSDGYSFTLGGTILHENKPPGFIKTNKGMMFTDPGFPFGVTATPVINDVPCP